MTRAPTATSHTYRSHRLRLHYLDWGNADAPPMLLVHGSQDHCHSWDEIAREFAPDYHVIAVDLRGHGDSEWARGSTYSSMEYVYDIAQLIHQCDLHDVTLLAHSMGGSLALKYAGIYPERLRQMVIIEGVGLWRFGQLDEPDAAVHEVLRDWIGNLRQNSARLPRRYPTEEEAYDRMHQQNSHLTTAQARYLTQHGSSQNEDGSFSWKFDNYTRTWTPFDIPLETVAKLWERITCPVLFMNAREGYGQRTGQDGTLAHFQRGQLVNVDDAGHWLHHDQLDEFLRQTRAFLATDP